MTRILALWAPDWPVVPLLGELPAGARIAVMAQHRVLACSASARAEGVRRGMKRRDAQARCPDLLLRDHQPEAEARAFEDVLAAIEQITPGVAPLRPGLCALHVPTRFYGGEIEAAAVIAERLVGLGVWDVRAGIADGLFAAEQAARQAPTQDAVVVPSGESAAFLRGLPVDVLEEPDLVSLLRRMGLLTLGDFAALSAADVHTRFGRDGALLHRRASGLDTQPVSRRAVPPELTASTAFEPPLDRVDQIAFSLRTTAERFVADLADRGLVCTTVGIEVDADSAVVSQRRWMHPRWFGPTDLLDRVRWQLQGRPGEGSQVTAPVDAVRFVPEVVEPLGEHAESLFGSGRDERVERGVARVQGIVGHDAVVSVQVQGGRDPRDRQLTVPWGDKPVAARAADQPWPGQVPAPAPTTVFEQPREAWVVGAEGRSVDVTDRGVVTGQPVRFRPVADSDWVQIAAWAGPWPVEEHGARFQLVGTDGTAWLLHVQDARWRTEARYD